MQYVSLCVRARARVCVNWNPMCSGQQFKLNHDSGMVEGVEPCCLLRVEGCLLNLCLLEGCLLNFDPLIGH